MKPKHKSLTLYCFTPLATLITFFIEILLAAYVLFRYKMNPFVRISVLILIFLGLFQLSEYEICQTDFQEIFTKIGYISITLLPALGLNLVNLATKKNIWTSIGYILSGIFSFVIIFVPDIFMSTTCPGKFVIFTNLPAFNIIYTIYYYGFLAVGSIILFQNIIKNSPRKELYIWMLLGYGSFVVPTTVLYIIEKFTLSGVVSIMCGFAILFAIILVFKILPLQKKYNEK